MQIGKQMLARLQRFSLGWLRSLTNEDTGIIHRVTSEQHWPDFEGDFNIKVKAEKGKVN